MQSGELRRIITDQRSDVERKFGSEVMIEREKTGHARKFLGYPNILTVLGVRRCGKSTFSLLLAKELNEKFGYVNFDDERLIGASHEDLNRILEVFYELYGTVDLIVLDEPQNVRGWELFASRLRQTKKVIVTGSNSRLLGGELATALTGRHIDLLMSPFSFRETLSFEPDMYRTEDIAMVKKEFDSYLIGSGFPEFLRFGPPIVRSIYEDIVTRDCLGRHEIRGATSFRELARYLVSNFSLEFTYSRLSRVTGIRDVHTVKNYVEYLEQAFLIRTLKRFSFKLKEQTIAPRKVYVVDHGFANFMGFRLGDDPGRMAENMACMDLLSAEGSEVYYYKNSRGHEVDFVIRQGPGVKQLIQVCWDLSDPEVRKRELRSLVEGSEDLGCRDLLVLTGDQEGTEDHQGRKIKVMPLWKWLLQRA